MIGEDIRLSRASLAILDVETGCGRIIEIGVARFDGGRLTRTFRSLVNPGFGGIRCSVEWNLHVHGIEQEAVREAPLLSEIVPALVSMFAGATLVAHNAISVEKRLLTAEFARLGLFFEAEWLCSLALARAAWPNLPSHSLSALCRWLEIEPGRHRALPDALATAAVLAHLQAVSA